MLKSISRVAMAFVACSILTSAWADQAEVDGFTWYYSVKDGAATIESPSSASCEGPVAGYSGFLDIPAQINDLPVKGIASGALADSGIGAVKIPSSVTEVNSNAFCTGCDACDLSGSSGSRRILVICTDKGDSARVKGLVGTSCASVIEPIFVEAVGTGIRTDSAATYDSIDSDIQIKVAKAKAGGGAKVTAKYGKVSFSGIADGTGDVVKMVTRKKEKIGKLSYIAEYSLQVRVFDEVIVGTLADSNTFGGYQIVSTVVAFRNRFIGKSADDKAFAAQSLKDFGGVYNIGGNQGLDFSCDVGWASASGTYGSATVGAKGKVSFTGNSYKTKGQLVVCGDAAYVGLYSGTSKYRFYEGALKIQNGQASFLGNANAICGNPGTLATDSVFGIDEDSVAALKSVFGMGGTFLAEDLPIGLSVRQDGKKLVVADGQKGSVKMKNLAVERKGLNRAALKLSCKTKDGTISGSFKVYAIENVKLKAYTFKIFGVMVGDKGYGIADLKKRNISIPFTIGLAAH